MPHNGRHQPGLAVNHISSTTRGPGAVIGTDHHCPPDTFNVPRASATSKREPVRPVVGADCLQMVLRSIHGHRGRHPPGGRVSARTCRLPRPLCRWAFHQRHLVGVEGHAAHMFRRRALHPCRGHVCNTTGMGCGCGGGKKTQYEYTSPDGRKQIVQSQTEALTLVRQQGGTWRILSN